MNSPTQNNINNESINLNDIVKTVTKHWYLFVISVVCCVALSLVYIKVSKDKYAIHANILIRTDSGADGSISGAFMQQMGLGSIFEQGSRVDNEIHIISSHSLLRDVVEQMGLNKTHIYRKSFLERTYQQNDYAIDVTAHEAISDTLQTSISFKIKVDKEGLADIKAKAGDIKLCNLKNQTLPAQISTAFGDFTITTTPDYIAGEKYNYRIILRGYDSQAELLAEDVDIFTADQLSDKICLAIQTPYIDYGKEVLNTIIDLYNQRGIREKNIETANSAKFIAERLAIIAAELEEVEKTVEEYKQKNNLSDLEAEAKAMLESNMSFRTKLLEAETQLQVIEYTLEFITNPSNEYSMIPFSQGLNEVAAHSIETYNELILQYIKVKNSSKENNPLLHMMQSQIDEAKKNVISTVENAKESTRIALAELRKQESRYDNRIQAMPKQEREFISIYRQKVIKEELYIFLLQRQEENEIALATTTPKGQIIDAAYNLNEPVNMSSKMILLLSIIIGCILPAVYLYLKALFNTKFGSKEELERITRIPILGEVCINTSKESIVVRKGDNSSISELFRLLRTNLQFLLTNKNDKVILTTSSVSGEGKSFISLNLATSLALLNKKVIIIGLDIRVPKLGEYIGKTSRLGVTNYLSSEDVDIDQIITSSGIDEQLDVILAGPIPPNPTELLLGNRLDGLFEELRNRYDYIIVDSAPVGMVSDTFSLMRIADTVVYICRANYTQVDAIRHCNDYVTQGRLRNVSLVINATEAKQNYGYNSNKAHK